MDESADTRVPDTGPGGTVVLLNGPSSSGKSSIARELLDLLDGTWFHLSVDAFHRMRNDHPIADDDLQAEIDRTAKGFHRAVAGMAAAGNDLVVDYPLTRPWRVRDLVDLLVPGDTVLVAVRCPLPVLLRREADRGDREAGLAEAQHHQVFRHGHHDVEVDTSVQDAGQCARHIRRALAQRPSPTAFETLRARCR